MSGDSRPSTSTVVVGNCSTSGNQAGIGTGALLGSNLTALAYDQNYLYLEDLSNTLWWRITLDGTWTTSALTSAGATVASDSNAVVVGNYIYISNTIGGVRRMPITGGTETQIFSTQVGVLATDGYNIYANSGTYIYVINIAANTMTAAIGQATVLGDVDSTSLAAASLSVTNGSMTYVPGPSGAPGVLYLGNTYGVRVLK